MSEDFVLHTSRLQLRWLRHDDDAFILRLVNDIAWLRFIGDKQVSDLVSARRYIDDGPGRMYRNFGFGLNRVALQSSDTPIGICGLLRRDSLPGCDLGFALLPEYRGQGYAFEAASKVLQHGFEQLGKTRILALVARDNLASIALLQSLGFRRENSHPAEPKYDSTDLYSIER